MMQTGLSKKKAAKIEKNFRNHTTSYTGIVPLFLYNLFFYGQSKNGVPAPKALTELVLNSITCYPFLTIYAREMHDKTRKHPRYIHSLDCAMQIMDEEGLNGFYGGYGSFLYKWSPYYAMWVIAIAMGKN